MKKLYELQELMDVNFKAYTIAMKKLRREIGGTDEGLFRYTKQAGYLVDLNGIVYRPLY
jgi:hypothetical protein